MKKAALILAIAGALALTACGGKNTENTQTEAASEQASDTQEAGDYTEAKLPEEYDQEVYSGIVTDYTGSFITVAGEDDEKKFDLSQAEVTYDQEEPIVRGCSVELTYADAAANGTYPADSISLLNDNEQLAQDENCDPVIYGKLQVMDTNELEIIDDAGRTIDFDNSISRTVSFSDLKEGDNVVITYAGTINKSEDADDELIGVFSSIPVAIKIVALDALKTEEAEANYIDGTVSGIDGNIITLSTELADFECNADESMVNDVSEETHIRVYYTGALSDIVLGVDKIEQLD